MSRSHLGLTFLAFSLIAGFAMLSRSEAQDANPQAASRFAKSRIDKVTVYPNNALVTREPKGGSLAFSEAGVVLQARTSP